MYFQISVHLDNGEKIIKEQGLASGGSVQMFFANEVRRISDPYVPMDNGVLKNTAVIETGGNAICYITPYALVHWYGKVMVDPITGKGAFHDAETGRFWSRPKEQGIRKVPTDRDMKYRGAPLRGPYWVERAVLDNRDVLLLAVEKKIMER